LNILLFFVRDIKTALQNQSRSRFKRPNRSNCFECGYFQFTWLFSPEHFSQKQHKNLLPNDTSITKLHMS